MNNLVSLRQLPTFKEYVEGKVKTGTWKSEFKDFVLENSKPEKIKKVDTLAEEFNADIGRIQTEKDLNKLRDFYQRVMDIKNADIGAKQKDLN